jgi:hypothetical protein
MGDVGDVAAGSAAEFQEFGVKFIIWTLFGAIVASICGSDIVKTPSHATPPSIVDNPANSPGAMARSGYI